MSLKSHWNSAEKLPCQSAECRLNGRHFHFNIFTFTHILFCGFTHDVRMAGLSKQRLRLTVSP